MKVYLQTWIDPKTQNLHFSLSNEQNTLDLEIPQRGILGAKDARAYIANQVQVMFGKWEIHAGKLPTDFKEGVINAIFD